MPNKILKILNPILIILFLMTLLFLVHFTTQGWTDASRFATIEKLVDKHTFAIDGSLFAMDIIYE